MKRDYYGTKRITAWPEQKNGEDGYAVQYDHGYTSWSPKAVFEAAYQPLDAMSFGHAVEALKAGHAVQRQGWNGKGMWLELQRPTALSKMTLPYIYMKTADDNLVPWLASQTDVLANDWRVFERGQINEGV